MLNTSVWGLISDVSVWKRHSTLRKISKEGRSKKKVLHNFSRFSFHFSPRMFYANNHPATLRTYLRYQSMLLLIQWPLHASHTGNPSSVTQTLASEVECFQRFEILDQQITFCVILYVFNWLRRAFDVITSFLSGCIVGVGRVRTVTSAPLRWTSGHRDPRTVTRDVTGGEVF